MGSTVILLFGKDRIRWLQGLQAEHPLQMGQPLGKKR
jgi:phosphatidylserine decarboxylase